MAALLEAIEIKRKMFFELEETPFHCLDVEISTPTAGDKFKEPDLVLTPASYLYSDGEGSHFMDQETYETHTLGEFLMGDALNYLTEGLIVTIQKFNGNPIGLQMPTTVELTVTYTEPGARGDTASGNVTKPAKLETGIEIKVPLFIKEGEKVKVSTETGEFGGRA